MEQTPKGFKKPTAGDPNDLYQFVGDNMDLLETELDKKQDVNHVPYSTGVSPPTNKKLLWIDTSV